MPRIPHSPLNVLLVTTWHEQEIDAGIAAYAREAGWVLRNVSRLGHVPSDWRGDGVITYARPSDTRLVSTLRSLRKPVVNLGIDRIPRLACAQVLPDNEAIGRLAAEHLLAQGYRQLAFFSFGSDALVLRERYDGFAQVGAASKVPVRRLSFDGAVDQGTQGVMAWLVRHLRALPKPVGIMGHYDEETDCVVYACIEAGLRIPDEVALVSVDNDYVHCECGPVPLTSIDCNFPRIGYRAAEVLGAMMRGAAPPRAPLRVPPARIVVRKSSDQLQVESTPVRKALAHIRAHFTEGLRADDLVRVAGVSRRQLYRLFEQHHSRSLHGEIRRQRLEYAKRLLLETDQKLEAIASHTGFGSSQQLSKAFRQDAGVPPGDYRRHAR